MDKIEELKMNCGVSNTKMKPPQFYNNPEEFFDNKIINMPKNLITLLQKDGFQRRGYKFHKHLKNINFYVYPDNTYQNICWVSIPIFVGFGFKYGKVLLNIKTTNMTLHKTSPLGVDFFTTALSMSDIIIHGVNWGKLVENKEKTTLTFEISTHAINLIGE